MAPVPALADATLASLRRRQRLLVRLERVHAAVGA